MTLLVRRDEQRPLIGVAALARDVVRAEIVGGRPRVLEETGMRAAVVGEHRSERPRLAGRHFAWNGFLGRAAIDAVPQQVEIAVGRLAAGRCLERVLQVLPIDRPDHDEMVEHLHDRPRVGCRAKRELLG